MPFVFDTQQPPTLRIPVLFWGGTGQPGVSVTTGGNLAGNDAAWGESTAGGGAAVFNFDASRGLFGVVCSNGGLTAGNARVYGLLGSGLGSGQLSLILSYGTVTAPPFAVPGPLQVWSFRQSICAAMIGDLTPPGQDMVCSFMGWGALGDFGTAFSTGKGGFDFGNDFIGFRNDLQDGDRNWRVKFWRSPNGSTGARSAGNQGFVVDLDTGISSEEVHELRIDWGWRNSGRVLQFFIDGALVYDAIAAGVVPIDTAAGGGELAFDGYGQWRPGWGTYNDGPQSRATAAYGHLTASPQLIVSVGSDE